MVDEEKEQSVKEKIKGLLDKKYTRGQLINDFGFARSTVDTAISEYKESHGGELPSEHATANEDKPEAKGNEVFSLPVTLKAGGGREVINPEAIMGQYLLSDGESGKWMLKGMMMLRAAQMMVLTDVEIMKGQAEAQSKAIQPILSLMEKSREDMDAAAQRAKESNQEVAMRAAAGVGAQIMPEIEALKGQMIATSPNPMMSMFAQTMQPLLGQVMGNMMTMFQPKPGQPQPGTQPGGQPAPGQTAFQQPAGQQATETEVKEAFND